MNDNQAYNNTNNSLNNISLPNLIDKKEITNDILSSTTYNNAKRLTLNEIIQMSNNNMEKYKNCLNEIVYSETDIIDKHISYNDLTNLLNLKDPFIKDSYTRFKYKNYSDRVFFDSNFESGNLRMAIKISEYEYDLILRPETNCIRNFQWFFFLFKENYKHYSNNNSNKSVYKFNIINLTKKSISFNNDTVKILSYFNDGWSRDTFNIYYYQNGIPNNNEKSLLNNNNNNNNGINLTLSNFSNNKINLKDSINNNNDNNIIPTFYTLTFSFDVNKIQTPIKYIYFSYCYPYTYTHLLTFISNLTNCKNYLRFEEIGKSLLNNNLYMLIITDFTDSFECLAKKPAVVLTSRVHPGETNSSIVIEGLIESLLSENTTAKNLRKKFIFKIVPMLNIDGVKLGNYRMNYLGLDLNRTWNESNILKNPTIFHIQKMLLKTLNSREIFLFCDFHGHSNKSNFFIYSCNKKNPSEKIFNHIFKNENCLFDMKSCIDRINPQKIKTARAIVRNKFNIELSLCLESSISNYKSTSGNNQILFPFNIETYKKIGNDFLATLDKFSEPKIYSNYFNIVKIEILGFDSNNSLNGKNYKNSNNDSNKNENNKKHERNYFLPCIKKKWTGNGNNLIIRNKSETSIRNMKNYNNNNYNSINISKKEINYFGYKKNNISNNSYNNNGNEIRKQKSNVIEKKYKLFLNH